MSSITFGGLGTLLLFIAIVGLRLPIGFAMALVGFLGSTYLIGLEPAVSMLGMVPYATASGYMLTIIPLFVLMGQVMTVTGVSHRLYSTIHCWTSGLPGGLSVASIGACSIFAAACGSSLATAASIGSIAIPEMKRYKYAIEYNTGSVAAGGTLGILIPPSITLAVYGILTETSIGKLFIAGIVPGIILAGLYICVSIGWAVLNPKIAPESGLQFSWAERLKGLKDIWGVISIIILVLGGLYLGVFTPTEAGSVGAFGSIMLGFSVKAFTRDSAIKALLETGRITCMIFIVLIGAMFFQYFLALSGLSVFLANWMSSLPISRYGILGMILILLIFLGCFVDALAMILLTTPILFPIIIDLGFDPIWFGVIMTITCEMGLITPPVGMNVYVIAGLVPDVPIIKIFKGVLPFLLALIFALILFILIPQLVIFLPARVAG